MPDLVNCLCVWHEVEDLEGTQLQPMFTGVIIQRDPVIAVVCVCVVCVWCVCVCVCVCVYVCVDVCGGGGSGG